MSISSGLLSDAYPAPRYWHHCDGMPPGPAPGRRLDAMPDCRQLCSPTRFVAGLECRHPPQFRCHPRELH